MTTYTISDGTHVFNISELGITKNGEDLDLCTVIADGKFNNDSNVVIYYDLTPVFYGITKKTEEQNGGTLFKTTCYERAVELKSLQYLSGSNPIFTKTGMTVNALIDDIITSTGWTRGSSDTSTIASLNCYYVNKLQAINKVIRDMKGYYLWFNSNTKTIYFGVTGVDKSSTAITYLSKTLKSSTEARNVTKVIVLGKDASIVGTAGTGTNVATFQVSDITTASEATSIATSILNDIGNEYVTYDVIISPDLYSYEVRDKILVDSSYYYIKNISQTLNEITLTVDTGKTSVLDSLGSRITEVTGSFPSGASVSWSGGNSNIAANGASYTEYTWQIDDVTLITDALFSAAISQFQVSTGVSATTDYLSEISNIVDNGSYTGSSVTTISSSTYYLPDGVSTDTSCLGIITTPIAHGYQLGLCTAHMNIILNSGYSVTLQWQVVNGASGTPPWTWTDVGPSITYSYSNMGSSFHIDFPVLVSGSSIAESSGVSTTFRLKVTGTANQYKLYGCYLYIQRVPRHIHSVSTTYDKSVYGTPPSSVTFKVNSGSDTTFIPGTTSPVDVTSLLHNGKNTIYIKTPSGTGNQCSVCPTITYNSLGKS